MNDVVATATSVSSTQASDLICECLRSANSSEEKTCRKKCTMPPHVPQCLDNQWQLQMYNPQLHQPYSVTISGFLALHWKLNGQLQIQEAESDV